REIERLLQWTWWGIDKQLAQLTRQDFENFIEFCQNPPIDWIGSAQVARFLNKEGIRQPNPKWRPFVHPTNASRNKYSLSQKSLTVIFSSLSSFFNFLLQEDYVGQNPIAQ